MLSFEEKVIRVWTLVFGLPTMAWRELLSTVHSLKAKEPLLAHRQNVVAYAANNI
jgi:hypothetical protein